MTGQVIEATRESPYLCLAIDLDARQIADLIAQSGDAGWSRGETSRGLFVGEVDAAMLESVLRLARLLDAPRDIPVRRAAGAAGVSLPAAPEPLALPRLRRWRLPAATRTKIGQIIR